MFNLCGSSIEIQQLWHIFNRPGIIKHINLAFVGILKTWQKIKEKRKTDDQDLLKERGGNIDDTCRKDRTVVWSAN